jgi:hypothetical protein
MIHEQHSDPLDVSVAQQEIILAAQIAARKPEGPPPSGYCLNCGEQLTDDDIIEYIKQGNPAPPGVRRHCDADCRTDWEKRQRVR